MPKETEIEISQLRFERKLGEGNFGVVFEANLQNKNDNSNQKVACKLLKSQNSISSEENYQQNSSEVQLTNKNISIEAKKLQEFLEEAQIMIKIPKNKHLVKLIGICIDPVCILSEYIDGGNLKQYLDSKEIEMKVEEAIEYMKEICEGMNQLHQNQIIHRLNLI